MKDVTIYSTPWCHFCAAAKEYFSQNNVKYTEIDVSKDQTKAQEMVEKSGQMGVPVIEIGGKIIVGFNKPEIEKALGL